jgi:hypothetical protein
MIVLDNIGFNSDATELQVVVTAPLGDEWFSAKLWTSSTYKGTDSIDIVSYFPAGARPGTPDTITIPVAAIGETNFNGVFYIEITTTTGGMENATSEFAVSNTTVYNTCILDKLLQVSVIDCVPTVTTDCLDLEGSQITFINTLLESLEYALLQENLLAAQDIETKLMSLCTDRS